MEHEQVWISFFGNLITNKTGIENVMVAGNELLPEQEEEYPKVRFSLTEIDKSISTIIRRDKGVPSTDPNFKLDIERSYTYTPLWLCSINISDKVDNNSLDKVGRLVLDRRRVLNYLRTFHKDDPNFNFYKNSSFKRAVSTDLSDYVNSQDFHHKKLNIEFAFSITETEIINTIEKVETDMTIKEV